MSFNIFHLLVLLVFVIVLVRYVCFKSNITQIKKFYYVLAMFGMVAYSGISTTYVEGAEKYIWHFILFIVVFSGSFIISDRLHFTLGHKHLAETNKNSTESISDGFLIGLFLIFLSYYFVQLVYPNIRIVDLFHLHLSITGIFERREATRSNYVYQIFYYLNLVTMVFSFILLNRLRKRRKSYLVLFLFVFWIYLKTVVLGYIGRYEIITVLFFAITIISCKDEDSIVLSNKVIVSFSIIVMLLVPFLLAYESFRLGRNAEITNYYSSINDLFESETSYGKYYDQCVSLASEDNLLNYWKWLLSLPLPSAVFKFKDNIELINVYFSEYILNVPQGSRHFYIVLPSILGESFIIYGKYFFWIHALVLGFFINKFSTLMEKNSELEMINLYFAVSCLALGRGGTGSVFPAMINCMVFYLLLLAYLRGSRKRD